MHENELCRYRDFGTWPPRSEAQMVRHRTVYNVIEELVGRFGQNSPNNEPSYCKTGGVGTWDCSPVPSLSEGKC